MTFKTVFFSQSYNLKQIRFKSLQFTLQEVPSLQSSFIIPFLQVYTDIKPARDQSKLADRVHIDLDCYGKCINFRDQGDFQAKFRLDF